MNFKINLNASFPLIDLTSIFNAAQSSLYVDSNGFMLNYLLDTLAPTDPLQVGSQKPAGLQGERVMSQDKATLMS